MPKTADVTTMFIDTEVSFPTDLHEKGFTHVIHSGSAHSINHVQLFTSRAVTFIKACVSDGIPQMGICFGHQLICLALLGSEAVRSSPNSFEAGWGAVEFSKQAQEMFNIRATEKIWQHHFDEVIQLPEGSKLLATNQHSEVQAYMNQKLRLFGTQFHPEFDKENGNKAYLADRANLEKHQFNVDKIVKEGPSFDAGTRLFDFFLATL
jgi:GMP synthase-like glutamine amidotransferase